MNILVLAPRPFFQLHGTAIYVRRVVELLPSLHHTVDVLTYPEGEDPCIPGCSIRRLRPLPGLKGVGSVFSWKHAIYDICLLLWCLAFARRSRYQLIHAIDESVFVALICQWLFGIPFIYDRAASSSDRLVGKAAWLTPLRNWISRMERRAAQHSRGIITSSTHLEETACQLAPWVPVVRVEGLNSLGRACPLPESETWAHDDQVTYMYVGSLEPHQGIDLLLEAFVHLFHRQPGAQLVVVGGTLKCARKYRRKAAAYGVDARAHFIGPRVAEQLSGYLKSADVLVSPRVTGNCPPMKVFSYLQSGKPILATRLEAHMQVLDDRVALLVSPSPLEMAWGMEELMTNSPLYDQIVQNAAELKDSYCDELIQAKLSLFYDDIAVNLTHHRPLNARPERAARAKLSVETAGTNRSYPTASRTPRHRSACSDR